MTFSFTHHSFTTTGTIFYLTTDFSQNFTHIRISKMGGCARYRAICLSFHQTVSYKKHFRPGIAFTEEVLLWAFERENFWMWPGYAFFGGQLMLCVTPFPYIVTNSVKHML